jgi:hypothetical protein
VNAETFKVDVSTCACSHPDCNRDAIFVGLQKRLQKVTDSGIYKLRQIGTDFGIRLKSQEPRTKNGAGLHFFVKIELKY